MPTRFDIRFTPSLPGGKALLGVATEEGFTWLVAEGHMSEQCRAEMLDATRGLAFWKMWADLWAEREKDGPAAEQEQEAERDPEAGAA